MSRRWKMLSAGAAAIMAVGLLGACGGDGGDGGGAGDGGMSREQFSREVSGTVQQLSQQFGQQLEPVFQALDRAGIDENQEIPPPLERQAQAIARSLAQQTRETGEELARLEPPEGAEEPREQLVQATREQADRLEQVAGQDEITLREFADATEMPPDVRQALQTLRERGFEVQPPPGG
ncbi:MAG: hypothetical protein M3459_03565 [Actinomycetota bacterium]|nr:hypothetical protein [Actinomycetota bacterium]